MADRFLPALIVFAAIVFAVAWVKHVSDGPTMMIDNTSTEITPGD